MFIAFALILLGAEDSAEVKKLLKERIAALRNALEVETASYKAGKGAWSSLTSAAVELATAELELADTAEKKRAILLTVFKLAEEMDERAVLRIESGVGELADHFKARAFRLKAEIDLRRAGGTPPKGTKPPRDPKGRKDE